MFCDNCGCKNNEVNKFCENCGNQLNCIKKKDNKNKDISLILGIVCIISSFFISIINIIPGIVSIVYSSKYKKESGKYGVGFGLSITGMSISIIIFILSLLLLFIIITGVDNNSIDNSLNKNNQYIYIIKNIR